MRTGKNLKVEAFCLLAELLTSPVSLSYDPVIVFDPTFI